MLQACHENWHQSSEFLHELALISELENAFGFFNKRIATHTCECCRLDTAIAPDNTLVITWWHIIEGGIRDHALVKFNDWNTPGNTHRLTGKSMPVRITAPARQFPIPVFITRYGLAIPLPIKACFMPTLPIQGNIFPRRLTGHTYWP